MLQEKLEAKEAKRELYVAFLDAKAAFDIVPHASLLRKLFIDGVTGDALLLSCVKWKGIHSTPFIKQGVCQGGILSAE